MVGRNGISDQSRRSSVRSLSFKDEEVISIRKQSFINTLVVTLTFAAVTFWAAHDIFQKDPNSTPGGWVYCVALFWATLGMTVIAFQGFRSKWWLNEEKKPKMQLATILIMWLYLAFGFFIIWSLAWSPMLKPVHDLYSIAVYWIVIPVNIVVTLGWLIMKRYYDNHIATCRRHAT